MERKEEGFTEEVTLELGIFWRMDLYDGRPGDMNQHSP